MLRIQLIFICFINISTERYFRNFWIINLVWDVVRSLLNITFIDTIIKKKTSEHLMIDISILIFSSRSQKWLCCVKTPKRFARVKVFSSYFDEKFRPGQRFSGTNSIFFFLPAFCGWNEFLLLKFKPLFKLDQKCYLFFFVFKFYETRIIVEI